MSRNLLSVSGWPLRRKLALALAVPMLFAATFGSLRVAKEVRSSAEHSASQSQVTVLPPAVAYLDAAEDAAVVARRKTAAIDPARDKAVVAVNKAADDLAAAARAADLTAGQDAQVASILDLSTQLRDGTAYLSVGQSVSQVRQLHAGVTELITQIMNEQAEPEPRLLVLQQVLDGRLSLSMQQFQVAYDNGADASQVDLASELGVEAAAIDRLGAALGTTQEQVSALTQGNAQRYGEVVNGGVDMGNGKAYAPYDTLSPDLLAEIDGDLTAAAGRARLLAIASAVVTGVALLVAALLALLVARTLTRPIRTLRDGALHVADDELPETVARIRAGEDPGEITPIDIGTEEEIGQLARAFDEMHRQAVTLAAGEAELRTQIGDMFVTLSRRNTSLINQQLGLIESLEQDEEDPRRLDSLFRLDHLASRMRRTADSLMVLADAPSQTGDGSALTVSDVLQAAIAGVRDYQRVQFVSTPTARISAAAAPDVVHLLTELVDNALSYSPPTSMVRVQTTASVAGVLVEIADAGLGIPEDELARLNAQLLSGGEVTADTARRMGLLVVSRLARRHGLRVQLEPNADGGTTARVVLPAQLLHGQPEPAAPVPAPTRLPERSAERVVEPAPDPVDLVARSIEPQTGTPAVAGLPQRRVLAEWLAERAPEPEPEPEPVPEPVAVTVPEPQREPEPAAAPEPAEEHGFLDADVLVPLLADATPIFQTLQSNWFSGDHTQPWSTSEIEAGWRAADRVAEVPVAQLTHAGLPIRRPGQHLVPGGVTPGDAAIVRDPEAIRARLAAHAAGVSRGRTAVVPPDPSRQEVGPA